MNAGGKTKRQVLMQDLKLISFNVSGSEVLRYCSGQLSTSSRLSHMSFQHQTGERYVAASKAFKREFLIDTNRRVARVDRTRDRISSVNSYF